MKRSCLLFMLLLFASGCAHILSKDARLSVDPLLEFAQVKQDPEAFKGRVLLLGGRIVSTEIDGKQTTFEVLLYTLDRWGEPEEVDPGGGRILVQTERFIDLTDYGDKPLITLTGTVQGKETRLLGRTEYHYPVFRLIEAYIWPPPRQRRIYPGPWPPPYYYNRYPYYDPFWYDYDPYWHPYYDPYRDYPPGLHIK